MVMRREISMNPNNEAGRKNEAVDDGGKGRVRLGLEIYSLREAFSENPDDTIRKVAEMGYESIEFAGLMKESAEYYRERITEAGLDCSGWIVSWNELQGDELAKTIDYNRRLGSPVIIIGSVPVALVKTESEISGVIGRMLDIKKAVESAGFKTGYHNHDSDFFHVVAGKPLFEHFFDNTPEDFLMILDTGNAMAGGYDPVRALKRYPGRSTYVHIKGYSKEKGYLAYIGEDDINWEKLIRIAINVGGASSFSVEFGKRGDYDPFERAAVSYDRIRNLLVSKTG